MHWTGWIVIVLSLQIGGWMLFDGLHALFTGDYVTPSTGEYAGKLGPWAGLIQGIGIDPRSAFMKSVFVVYGLFWILSVAGFLFKVGQAWFGLLALSIFSLWYIPFGTVISLVISILLMLPPLRAGFLE